MEDHFVENKFRQIFKRSWVKKFRIKVNIAVNLFYIIEKKAVL